MVHPDYQRKGVGGKLLTGVTDKADAEGIPTMLVSSAEAHELYLRLGFETLGRWPIDNGYWAREIVKLETSLGMEGNEDFVKRFEGLTEVEDCMIRYPRKSDK
jgi:GNAT superfamily N-acetyltransferase